MTAPARSEGSLTIPLFLNGEGMRGGRVHPSIAHYTFLGEVQTAPRYRVYAGEAGFPALWPVTEGGISVPGDLYALPLEAVRDEFMPVEPLELELAVVEPADGSASLAVQLRPEVHARGPGLVDISDRGGWRAYQASRVQQ
ncbi:allophanate hydrolase-related protein [Geodermatophilus marinus]|uniref:allophanate hydrolase-related protein n=1 Tax=Geodermatophilus sp. LHW52908 TaxID=2303986 RepID=UPI000E3EC77F|nr:amidase [Geodermatophilus sp. LHW52908]RFU20486.1 amidase [Geodermatophilus sp. LHW52908]